MSIQSLYQIAFRGTLLRLLNSSSVFHKYGSSSYQRSRLNPLPTNKMRSLKTDFLEQISNMEVTTEKWQDIRENLLKTYKNINQNNIDATILGLFNEAKHLQHAKNYISFLNTTGAIPNKATLGRLLRIYNAVYFEKGKLSEDEESEVLKICDNLMSGNETLDAITCEHLICGLVTTKSRWKETLNILEMFRLTSLPTITAYAQIIMKAFLSNEMELGWKLLEEMVSQKRQPKCEIYLVLLDAMSKNPDTFLINFEKFLNFLEKHELLLTQKVSDYIKTLAKLEHLKFQVMTTRLNRIGKCINCSHHMRNVGISNEEYEKLRDSFLGKVLIRNDVFLKSTPEEVAKFKQYIKETAPYDCVIDGLNVAYSKGSKRSPKELANLLAAVVRYFDMKGKRVLVLGRSHMNQWPADVMKYVRQRASIFLTNNLTHDDPFMLYATLKSGQMTDFFSRDLMRSHAHLLGPELKSIFRRWQQEHQYSLITQTNTGKVIIKEPIRYLIHTHKVNDNWHVPLIPEYLQYLPETFEIPESWLCIQLGF